MTLILGDTSPPESAPRNFSGSTFSLNGNPQHDLAMALGRSMAVTFGLKYAIDSKRPNGKDGSFPSGHAAVAFSGAEFIRKEYGWELGAPAYLAGSFVGLSRIETRDHWWRDVIAGAALGIASNYDFIPGSFQVSPSVVMPATMTATLVQPSTVGLGLTFRLEF